MLIFLIPGSVFKVLICDQQVSFNEVIPKSKNPLPQLFVNCDIQTWIWRQVCTCVCSYLYVLHIILLMKLVLCY